MQEEEQETKRVIFNFEDCVSLGIVIELDEQDETFTWIAIVDSGKPEADTFLMTTRLSELISITLDATNWDAPMPTIRVDANVAYGPDIFQLTQGATHAEFIISEEPANPMAEDGNYFMGVVDYEPAENEPIIRLSDYKPMDLNNYWEDEEDNSTTDEEPK